MVYPRLVGNSAALLVRVLRTTAATGKADSVLRKRLEGFRRKGIARPGKGDRLRDAVSFALLVDSLQLLNKPVDLSFGNAQVVTRVVADLEPVIVERADLFPGEIVGLVRLEVPAFRDEERRPEIVLLEDRSRDGEMRTRGIVKREDGQACQGWEVSLLSRLPGQASRESTTTEATDTIG